MEIANKCLAADGLFLLHTIGSNKTVFAADEWITKYIFSHGMLPSIAQIGKASEDFFVMEDWHNFGADYDRTLSVSYTHLAHRPLTLHLSYYDEGSEKVKSAIVRDQIH